TAHKSQGLTMGHALIDLESCTGMEAPYVMLSHLKTLDGLVIMRPFSIKRITCQQSEDFRREHKRLAILNLQTII
ncbi:hypothetical protein EV363DRAFT_1068626, partial [Boletus edulis]